MKYPVSSPNVPYLGANTAEAMSDFAESFYPFYRHVGLMRLRLVASTTKNLVGISTDFRNE